MKEEIRLLVKDLHHACRQSLFNGNLKSVDDSFPLAKRQRKDDADTNTTSKSWNEILKHAGNNLLPFMTDHEFGEVSRVAGILLLGFLLPQSTGNEYYTLQNLSTQRKKEIPDYIIYMPLEERLENSLHHSGNDFGELNDTIENERLEFLESLKIFLSGRPAHLVEVDLIHILAMAIHPNPSDHCIRNTSIKLKENSEFYDLTLRLMRSLVSHSFQINYGHRVRLVEIVNNCLILPECHDETARRKGAPLFEGALPHLRASMYAFGMASTNQYDNFSSQEAMVNLALESGMIDVVKEEWSRLLHRLVDDRTNCASIRNSTWNCYSSNEDFCLHRARGDLLRNFLMRYSEFADEDFLQFALSSLTDAIEMQVDCWANEGDATKETESGNKNDGKNPTTDLSPCVLASLLSVSKELFHFLQPLKKDQQSNQNSDEDDEEIEETEDCQYRDMLISCVIQLVHHWDSTIVKEACNTLFLAFTYNEIWDDYVDAVFDSLVIAIDNAVKGGEECLSVLSIESLISAFSHRSLTFAVNLFQLLLKKQYMERNPLVVFTLFAAIANARPAVAQKHIDFFVLSIEKINDPDVNKHIVASILSCRKIHFFANDNDTLTKLMPIINSSSLRNWDKYQLSRHAMMTGNFLVAKELYRELANSALKETSYVWLSALDNVAEGEARLCNDAAKSLPDSTTHLRTAINSFRSLSVLQASDENFSTYFQIRLLEIRVSFLDLMISMRQLSMEMRLLGTEPKKFTRPHLHAKNIIKLFDGISTDYLCLYKKQGLFICQQSRNVLRSLQTLCSFVARAARRVFLNAISVDEENEIFTCRGDFSHPLVSKIKHLDSSVVSKMNKNIDTKIRGVIMLQIIDELLKTPIPSPRSFVKPKALPFASLRLAFDPEVHDRTSNGDIPLEIDRGTSIVILARGSIPQSLLSCARVPFSIALLWFTAISEDNSTASLYPLLPNAAPVSSGGRFFTKIKSQPLIKEGRYRLNVRLGCRDIRGTEWDLPTHRKDFPTTLFVKVVQSRNK